jgi:hypothetical protein
MQKIPGHSKPGLWEKQANGISRLMNLISGSVE